MNTLNTLTARQAAEAYHLANLPYGKVESKHVAYSLAKQGYTLPEIQDAAWVSLHYARRIRDAALRGYRCP
jgi:hypothetical protein